MHFKCQAIKIDKANRRLNKKNKDKANVLMKEWNNKDMNKSDNKMALKKLYSR
jgi:hypothetical protein